MSQTKNSMLKKVIIVNEIMKWKKCLDNKVYNERILIELHKTNENKNDIVSQKFEIY